MPIGIWLLWTACYLHELPFSDSFFFTCSCGEPGSQNESIDIARSGILNIYIQENVGQNKLHRWRQNFYIEWPWWIAVIAVGKKKYILRTMPTGVNTLEGYTLRLFSSLTPSVQGKGMLVALYFYISIAGW